MNDISNCNTLVCKMIMIDSVMNPCFSIKKEINWNKINNNLLEILLKDKNILLNFSEICYKKYTNIFSEIEYDPIHYKYYFWIKLILVSIEKNFRNREIKNYIRINHSCCEENCMMIDTLTNIVLNELLKI